MDYSIYAPSPCGELSTLAKELTVVTGEMQSSSN